LDLGEGVFIKYQVFRQKVGNVVELHERINNALASATPQLLENTWCEIKFVWTL
jgi:hypothetical protein